MLFHLHFIGFALSSLALAHIVFPRYFNWAEDLRPLRLINRQMMQVHTFFIALTVFLMGLLCISSANDLINTPLGQRIALGFAFFWAIRLVFQLFVYSPLLWRGKKFETLVHIVFTLFWVYLVGVFGSIGLSF